MSDGTPTPEELRRAEAARQAGSVLKSVDAAIRALEVREGALGQPESQEMLRLRDLRVRTSELASIYATVAPVLPSWTGKPLSVPVQLRELMVAQLQIARYAIEATERAMVDTLTNAGTAAPIALSKIQATRATLDDLLHWVGGERAAMPDFVLLSREDGAGGGGGAGGGE